MRYWALRIVATIYRIIGCILIVSCVLGTCASSVAAVAGASYMGQQFGYRATQCPFTKYVRCVDSEPPR